MVAKKFNWPREKFRDNPLRDSGVVKFSALPDGWVRCKQFGSTAPAGWSWAHNDRDMFSGSFRIALVKN